jgi:hypothetical protein
MLRATCGVDARDVEIEQARYLRKLPSGNLRSPNVGRKGAHDAQKELTANYADQRRMRAALDGELGNPIKGDHGWRSTHTDEVAH